jgi:hypothetical protein
VINVLEALDSPQWWKPWFQRGDWTPWRAFLAATFALPMSPKQLRIFRECTGRRRAPTKPAKEAWAICGRRYGKTRIMAMAAAFLAAFRDWRPHLSPGEIATIMLIAKDRKQARTAMRYLRSLFIDHPKLARLVERETDDSLELANRVVIEVTTASFRSVRGYSVAAIIADELSFWVADEGSANPAGEIIEALRPAMLTMPGSLLMVATSPYSRHGPVWETFRAHYGKSGSVLVWRAPTRRMNASVPQKAINAAYEKDPVAAAAEYGAEFRSDLESFIAREAIEACIVPDRHELAPVSGIRYVGFADAASGSGGDSFTAAVAHFDRQAGKIVVDALRERRPPFSPQATIREFSAFFRLYGVCRIRADRWGGAFPVEQFRQHGVICDVAELVKSAIYQELLPLLNSERVELLDNPRLVAQLIGLERRTARSGRDSIDHAPGAHDDVVNAVAGAIVAVATTRGPIIIPKGLIAKVELMGRAKRLGFGLNYKIGRGIEHY